jgi:hypothetical protein
MSLVESYSWWTLYFRWAIYTDGVKCCLTQPLQLYIGQVFLKPYLILLCIKLVHVSETHILLDFKYVVAH